MAQYWTAECLAKSDKPFTFSEVCQLATELGISEARLGVVRYWASPNKAVYRLFYVPAQHRDRTEAYRASGEWSKRIARDGAKVTGQGLVVVLEDFVKPYPDMQHNTDW
jgi:hypothetical protein